MVDSIMSFPERTKIQLLAPVVRGRKGTHAKLLEQAKRSGYVRVQIDGNLYELSEEISLDKNIKHNIEIVVDRLIVKPGIEKRLSDSIETVLDLAEGLLMVDTMDGNIHTAESALMRSNREAFLSIIPSVPAPSVWDLVIRWNLILT